MKKYKKEDLQVGMLVKMCNNREKHTRSSWLGMAVNTNIGICIVDKVGHSLSLDAFDDDLCSYFCDVECIYGFAPAHEANKFSIVNREII